MLHVVITAWTFAIPPTPLVLDNARDAGFDLDAAAAHAAVLVAERNDDAAAAPTEIWTTNQFVRNAFGWPALVLGVSSAVLLGISAGLLTEAGRLSKEITPGSITQTEAQQQYQDAIRLHDPGIFTLISGAVTGGLAVIGATFWSSTYIDGTWIDP